MTPEYRAASHLVAEMRGFDLGDDERLLQRDLPPAKRGLLLYRAAQWEQARELLRQVPDEPAARFLATFCTARLETPGAALQALPASTDEMLDQPTLSWGTGELLWAAGRPDEAERALACSASLGARLDLARLLYSRARYGEAMDVYRPLSPQDPLLEALLWLALEQPGEARKILQSCSAADKTRARQDPRLRLLDLPAPKTAKRRGSFELLDQEDSDLHSSRLKRRYSGAWPLGIKWTDELWAWCQELVATARVVALAATPVKRDGTPLRAAMVEVDKALYLAPNLEIPPPLWPRLDFEQAERALAGHLASVRRPRLSLPSKTRAFMGYREATLVPNPFTGEWQEAGPRELERHWTASPCLDSYSWGGAYSDDPWPDHIPEQPDLQLKLARRLGEVRQQAAGGICTFTMRTTCSRSQLSTELHPGGVYVWEVRHQGNPWPGIVEAFNRRLGTELATSLPLDVVAAVYGFEFATFPKLRRLMQAESDPAAWFDIVAATGHEDLRTAYTLRRYARHPNLEVRAALASAAVRYNWMFLLPEMISEESEEEFAAWMTGHYERGAPAPEIDEMGEPKA
jgi:hypothetical protein